jgi:hypothetical protein
MRETGRRPQAVIMVADVLELDMAGGKSTNHSTDHSAGLRAA